MTIKNHSKVCLIISAAIVCLALILTIFGHGINMGIDFEGGLSMQYDLKQAVTKGDTEAVLDGMNISSYTVTIQGFAKTLLLGVVVSMLSAILITRFLMNRFVNAGATSLNLYTKIKTAAEAGAGKEVEQ